jgi:hypothetical protein
MRIKSGTTFHANNQNDLLEPAHSRHPVAKAVRLTILPSRVRALELVIIIGQQTLPLRSADFGGKIRGVGIDYGEWNF